MKRIASLFAAGLLLLAANVSRGQNFWEPANGPLYGNVTCIAFDSVGTIFAGTDIAGIFRSRDHAKTWVSVDSGLTTYTVRTGIWNLPSRIEAIAVSPIGRVYAAGTGGVFCSANEGDSWTQIDSVGQNAIIVTPGNEVFAGNDSGVIRWNDSIKTWTSVLSSGSVGNFAVSSSGRIFAVLSGIVYSSIDNGSSWREDTIGQYYWHLQGIHDTIVVRSSYFTPGILAFDSVGSLFALCLGGIARFDTTTRAWYMWSYGSNGLQNLSSFTIDRNGKFWAAFVLYSIVSGYYESGLFMSTDLGVTWDTMNALSCCSSVSVVAAAPNGDLLCNFWDGLKQSTDNGSNWTNVQNGISDLSVNSNCIVVTPTGALIKGADYSLFRSSDDGMSWARVDSGLWNNGIGTLGISPKGRPIIGMVYAGIYISNDDGKTWSQPDTTMNGWFLEEFVNAPNSLVFGVSSTGDIFRSSDDGDHWIHTAAQPDSYLAAIAVAPTGHLFAACLHGIYRSLDKSDTWQKVRSIPDSSYVWAIIVTPSGKILVGTEKEGLLGSTNDGDSWFVIDSSLRCYSFTLNQQGHLFATIYNGVVVSSDDGISWQPVDSGLPSVPIMALASDSSGRIFAGTAFAYGIYRSANSTLNVEKESIILPNLSLTQNSPNPFPQSTTLSFTLRDPSYISIKLFDATGREVAALANGFFAAGEHEVPFARGTLPAGVYFYRLVAGRQSIARAMVIEP